MRATVNFETTDYISIARQVFDRCLDESGRYDVEVPLAGFGTLHLNVDCTAEYHYDKGDYYTPPCSELASAEFDIISWEFLDADGEPITSDFTTTELLNILN